jgi:hypothetical protein
MTAWIVGFQRGNFAKHLPTKPDGYYCFLTYIFSVCVVQYMCKTGVFSPALELTALHISILILNITYPGGREVAISEILNFQLSFFSQFGKGFCFIRKKLSKIKSNFAKCETYACSCLISIVEAQLN